MVPVNPMPDLQAPDEADRRARRGFRMMTIAALVVPLGFALMALSSLGSGFCSDSTGSDRDACGSSNSGWIVLSIVVLGGAIALFFAGLRNKEIAGRLREEQRVLGAQKVSVVSTPAASTGETPPPTHRDDRSAAPDQAAPTAGSRVAPVLPGQRTGKRSFLVGLAAIACSVWSVARRDVDWLVFSIVGLMLGAVAALLGWRAFDEAPLNSTARRWAAAGVLSGLAAVALSAWLWLR